jgi:hypothetical protein
MIAVLRERRQRNERKNGNERQGRDDAQVLHLFFQPPGCNTESKTPNNLNSFPHRNAISWRVNIPRWLTRRKKAERGAALRRRWVHPPALWRGRRWPRCRHRTTGIESSPRPQPQRIAGGAGALNSAFIISAGATVRRSFFMGGRCFKRLRAVFGLTDRNRSARAGGRERGLIMAPLYQWTRAPDSIGPPDYETGDVDGCFEVAC